MTRLVHELRYPRHPVGQQAYRALEERTHELLAPLATAHLIYFGLASSDWRIVMSAIETLKDIGEKASQAACPLWYTARWHHDKIVRDAAEEAALSFSSPPSPTQEECRAEWEKEPPFEAAWFKNDRNYRNPSQVFLQ